jgi:multisubunit Na+/H+ antiporter MnhE subunit
MIDRLSKDCLFKITHILAIYWSLVASAFLFGVTFWEIPKDNIRFADTILGFMLGSIISTIIGYYMGSKHNHKEESKNATTE